jgi:hypothetical protein
MQGKIARSVLARTTEGVLSVALVLGAFLVILYLLGVIFPTGTGLRSFVRTGGDTPRPSPAAESEEPTDSWDPVVATLAQVARSVKDRPADTVVWRASTPGVPLGERHAVQTLERSTAAIRFDGGAVLEIGENSLIILKGTKRRRGESEVRTSFLMLEGGVEARIPESGLDLDVAGPGGQAHIVPSGGATVRMNVNPDRSSTVSVLAGRANVASGGRSITVPEGGWVALDPSSGLGRVGRLPDRPRLLAPRENTTVPYRSLPPRVTFSWQGGPGEHDSWVEIARDREFHDLVASQEVNGSEFVHGNLKAGTYYWRVAGVRSGARGRASEAYRLDVALENAPPALDVEFPDGPVAGPRTRIRGATEPGAGVFIGEANVPTGLDGSFEYELALDRGINVVVVEAIDAAGNTTYRSRLVNAEY